MADLNDDIARYLSGKLSPQEMHALERKALDDPFLADALEGGAQSKSDTFGSSGGRGSVASFESDINDLQSRLSNRVGDSKKTVTLWTWPLRIAAGVVLLISASVVFVALYERDKDSQDLALNNEVSTPVPIPEPLIPPAASQPSVDDAIQEAPSSKITVPETPPKTKRAPAVAEDADERTGAKHEDKEGLADEMVEAEESVGPRQQKDVAPATPSISGEQKLAESEQQPTQSEALQAPAPLSRRSEVTDKKSKETSRAYAARDRADTLSNSVQGYAAAGKAGVAKRVIKGQVFDSGGTGLPGVNVIVKGTDIGTVTDALGHYQLTLDETDRMLAFSFIGYSSKEIDSKGKAEVNVDLADDVSQLSEVVVTGYGINRDDEEITSTVELAAPAGGRKAFKQYLERSMQYPQLALENKVEGKVTIQFAVESTGQLSDFRVLKGIGSGCDEEVIRIIKAGPKWSPTKKDSESLRGMVKVRMRFQLPKK